MTTDPTTDRWAAMLLWLAHEPLPAAPVLPGRVHECHDRVSEEEAADATAPADRRAAARQRAAATRRHNRELWLTYFARGAGTAPERA